MNKKTVPKDPQKVNKDNFQEKTSSEPSGNVRNGGVPFFVAVKAPVVGARHLSGSGASSARHAPLQGKSATFIDDRGVEFDPFAIDASLPDLDAPQTSRACHSVVVPLASVPGVARDQTGECTGGAASCLSIGAYRDAKSGKSLVKGGQSTLSIYSSDVVLKRGYDFSGMESGDIGGKKKAVTDFSKQSAREFCRQVRNQPLLNRVGVSGMATLTYGENHPHDSITLGKHIERIQKRLKRMGVGGYYMIEFQEERRVVHVHFILSKSVPPKEWGKMVVECTDQTDDKKALKVSSHPRSSQTLKSVRGASHYAAKYASKSGMQKTVPDDFKWSGRWWAKWGLPTVRPERVEVADKADHVAIRRLLRRKMHSERAAYHRTAITETGGGSLKVGLSPSGWYQDAAQWVTRGWRKSVLRGIHLGQMPDKVTRAYITRFPKVKDWDKMTFYGQAEFLRKHWTQLMPLLYDAAICQTIGVFGGSAIDLRKK